MFNTKHSESEPTTALRIQTNKEYENLVPPMSKEAFELCTLGRVNEKIAKDSGVSARQVSKIETILEKADSKLKGRVLNGTTKIDKAYRQIKNEERRLKLIAESKLSCAAATAEDNSNRIKLLQGDMRKLAYDELIPDSSID